MPTSRCVQMATGHLAAGQHRFWTCNTHTHRPVQTQASPNNTLYFQPLRFGGFFCCLSSRSAVSVSKGPLSLSISGTSYNNIVWVNIQTTHNMCTQTRVSVCDPLCSINCVNLRHLTLFNLYYHYLLTIYQDRRSAAEPSVCYSLKGQFSIRIKGVINV